MKPSLQKLIRLAKWVGLAVAGLLTLVICWVGFWIVTGIGGMLLPFPVTEITHEKPYADFIGLEYRVVGDVDAIGWNDFPDRFKILSISLTPAPGVDNRFVSFTTRLQPGQVVRIVSAWQQFNGLGFQREYVVSVPGAGLRDGIRITMNVNADGVPDPRVYEPIGK